LENLKPSLQSAYKIAGVKIRKAHDTNKKFYDRKATIRKFKVGEQVFLYNPARKQHSSKKFWSPWKGKFRVIEQLPNKLNYRIRDTRGKEFVVHVNQLQRARNQGTWKEKS
jgi:hypothetical protein